MTYAIGLDRENFPIAMLAVARSVLNQKQKTPLR